MTQFDCSRQSTSGSGAKVSSSGAAARVKAKASAPSSSPGVVLFVGRPGAECGHVVDASSYFDR